MLHVHRPQEGQGSGGTGHFRHRDPGKIGQWIMRGGASSRVWLGIVGVGSGVEGLNDIMYN